jgi:hypothetical protein
MIMKSLAAVPMLALLGLSLSVDAKPKCKQQTIEDLVKAAAESYETKTLGSLDADQPYVGRVRIVIEHSLVRQERDGAEQPERTRLIRRIAIHP